MYGQFTRSMCCLSVGGSCSKMNHAGCIAYMQASQLDTAKNQLATKCYNHSSELHTSLLFLAGVIGGQLTQFTSYMQDCHTTIHGSTTAAGCGTYLQYLLQVATMIAEKLQRLYCTCGMDTQHRSSATSNTQEKNHSSLQVY